MELLGNIGLNASCIAMFIVMAFLSFGQKLISTPEAATEEEKNNDIAAVPELPEIYTHNPLMSNK